METTLIRALFGHFIGDFFFQFRLMSDNKYLPGRKGFFWCSVHVLVYTIAVAVFVWNFSPLFLLGVYVPHWILDRYSIAYHWMKLLGRSSLINNQNPTKAAFGAIIYVTIDQTIHMGLLYALLWFV